MSSSGGTSQLLGSSLSPPGPPGLSPAAAPTAPPAAAPSPVAPGSDPPGVGHRQAMTPIELPW
ncbi:hypothetical protein HaLaN_23073, partial [Haematococcus lacustris]